MATHRNNFDFIRFCAASMVWFGHCFILYGRPADPLSTLTNFESFGSLGVKIFFIVSGYFITASFGHHALLSYARNRALRLLPALVVVVLLSTFALGPLVTSLNTGTYFSDSHTWRYLYTMMVFPVQYDLPGVFAANPGLHAVNGSLWSLQHEVRCYCYVALLGILGLLNWRMLLAVFIGLWCSRLYGTLADAGHLPHIFFFNRWSWGKMELALNLVILFCSGALLYVGRARIPLQWKYLALALLVMALCVKLPYGSWLFELALAYAVICIGFLELPLLSGFGMRGDFSYGMYLYAFPIQQLTIYALGAHADFIFFCIVSFVLTLLSAIASWHFVEKRALLLKA